MKIPKYMYLDPNINHGIEINYDDDNNNNNYNLIGN
jgi:hypothetical protein